MSLKQLAHTRVDVQRPPPFSLTFPPGPALAAAPEHLRLDFAGTYDLCMRLHTKFYVPLLPNMQALYLSSDVLHSHFQQKPQPEI